MNAHFFQAALFVYLAATGFSLAYLVSLRKPIAKVGPYVLAAGFAVHSLALVIRYREAGHTPVTNLPESLSFFSWAIAGLYLVLFWRYRLAILAAFVAPMAAVLMILASIYPPKILPLPPALESFWLPIHVILAFTGDAAFALAFAVGILYLIQERHIKTKKIGAFFRRLPPLQVLDELNYRCLTIGFPFLTLGILSGAIWAESAWGAYWSWDPKETWSLITWFLYAALLHGRLAIKWRGRKAAIWSVVGFAALIFTFVGVNLLLSGLHAYR